LNKSKLAQFLVVFARTLGEGRLQHQHREVFAHQVDPVHHVVSLDFGGRKIGRPVGDLGLVDEERGEREPGHEGVEAGPVASRVGRLFRF